MILIAEIGWNERASGMKTRLSEPEESDVEGTSANLLKVQDVGFGKTVSANATDLEVENLQGCWVIPELDNNASLVHEGSMSFGCFGRCFGLLQLMWTGR